LSAETTSKPYIVGSLLIGADDTVAEFVRPHVPHAGTTDFGPCTAFGIIRKDKLVGGVVFNNFRKFDIHMAATFEGSGWAMSRAELRTLCDYTFNQLGVARVTAVTGRKNKRARKALEIIGFTLEGNLARGLDGHESAMVYGLCREHCRWINK
jgi:RimJ/RimL family protein N-acetyltransferase